MRFYGLLFRHRVEIEIPSGEVAEATEVKVVCEAARVQLGFEEKRERENVLSAVVERDEQLGTVLFDGGEASANRLALCALDVKLDVVDPRATVTLEKI